MISEEERLATGQYCTRAQTRKLRWLFKYLKAQQFSFHGWKHNLFTHFNKKFLCIKIGIKTLPLQTINLKPSPTNGVIVITITLKVRINCSKKEYKIYSILTFYKYIACLY